MERKASLVVIVDDDESILDAVQDLLDSAGLPARAFGSAKEYLESGLCRETGCLIADIRMPCMSGLELQARLKADQCKVPIIFITAHGDARTRLQAMREGAVEFLSKPFDHQVLLTKVRAALAM
ncbi:MAG: response regulator [Acidobacteriaceae bacterium]|nr:response regulator [Acidobacteriaceae bacterium]